MIAREERRKMEGESGYTEITMVVVVQSGSNARKNRREITKNDCQGVSCRNKALELLGGRHACSSQISVDRGTPVDVDTVGRRRSVFAEFIDHKLLHESGIDPYLVTD